MVRPGPVGEPSTIRADGVKMVYIGHMENNHAILNYFTDDEWDALFEAICEYQDHGPEESDMSAQIQSKISKLFNWNSWATILTSTTWLRWVMISKT